MNDDVGIGMCPPSQPLWDPSALTCSECPIGTLFDRNKNECIPDQTCSEGEQFDETIDQCRKCYPW